MANYVLAFRSLADRIPSQEEEDAWGVWFGSLGAKVVDFGNRVGQVRTVAGDGVGEATPPCDQRLCGGRGGEPGRGGEDGGGLSWA